MGTKKQQKMVVGIDPGLSGALVFLEGHKMTYFFMPVVKSGKQTEIDFKQIDELISNVWFADIHFFLERAHAGAMGVTSAFNYGRGFAALEIALQIHQCAVTYVEPAKWTKVMHEGISADLKPKAKSLIAVKRLYPKLVSQIPTNRNGKLHEGVVDALLIAGYGQRVL